MHSLVQEGRRDAVAKAVRAAFGAGAAIEELEALKGGMSGAAVFRLRTGGRDHLLRLERPERDQADVARHLSCLALAAEAGVAPAVRYADAQDGLAITAFVEAQPLSTYAWGREAMLAELAGMVRSLQATTPFPPGPTHLDAADGFIADFRATGFLAEAAIGEHLLRFSQIREVWRTDRAAVSSHNDLNPGNILYDGRRLWLTDWEVAAASDPFGDLSCLAHSMNADEAQEGLLLGAWLGRPANEEEAARLCVMRQVWPMVQAMLILKTVAGQRPDLASRSPVLLARSLDRVMADIGAGRVDINEPEGRLEFGKALLDQLLVGLRSVRFQRSLQVIGDLPLLQLQ